MPQASVARMGVCFGSMTNFRHQRDSSKEKRTKSLHSAHSTTGMLPCLPVIPSSRVVSDDHLTCQS